MLVDRQAAQIGGTVCHCNRDPTCFLMRYEIAPVGHSPVIEQWLCRVCATVVILQPTYFALDIAHYFPELERLDLDLDLDSITVTLSETRNGQQVKKMFFGFWSAFAFNLLVDVLLEFTF
jgi:hypothetical protein